MARATSLPFNLFAYWQSVPPGVGVSMAEMMQALGVTDTQAIRGALTQLRKGEVPDPAERGRVLRPLPIRYNNADHLYYDFSQMSADAVLQQIPGTILTGSFGQLLTRVTTLDSSMGRNGLAGSAQQLLNDEETRALIRQLPFETIWRAHGVVLQIAQARQLLELETRAANFGTEDDEDT